MTASQDNLAHDNDDNDDSHPDARDTTDHTAPLDTAELYQDAEAMASVQSLVGDELRLSPADSHDNHDSDDNHDNDDVDGAAPAELVATAVAEETPSDNVDTVDKDTVDNTDSALEPTPDDVAAEREDADEDVHTEV